MAQTLSPTNEQIAILDAVSNTHSSINIQALAGSGKTSTLKLIAPQIRAGALCCAFNTRIKNDLEAAMPLHFDIATLNALGHRAWSASTGLRLNVQSNKSRNIVKKMLSTLPKSAKSTIDGKIVLALLDAARTFGLIPSGTNFQPNKGLLLDDEGGWEFLGEFINEDNLSEMAIGAAKRAIITSIEMAFQGEIDFIDQIYMSACFGGKFPTYMNVLLDEAQDISALNAHMLNKIAINRLILVGDSHQCIYGFRGAAAGIMEKMAAERKASTLPLTTCFRCSAAVVEEAAKIVPAIRSSADAITGSVVTLENWTPSIFTPNSAILCRNNAPLFSLAFKLLAQNYSIIMLNKDLGGKLKSLIQKFDKSFRFSRMELINAIGNYIEKLPEKRHDYYNDILATILAIPGATSAEIMDNVESLLLRNEGTISLSTIHASKGLEWHDVFFLDRHLLHSRSVKTQADKEQADNLTYVAITRAKINLTMICSKGLVSC